jgi:hypothetical protein
MIFPWLYHLKEDEQLLIEAFTKRWTIKGPAHVWTRPFWRVKRHKAILLGPTDYLRIRNTLTGELHNEIGPKLFFPEAYEEIVKRLEAIPLKHNQYVRLIDYRTGAVRVEPGEQTVYLNPTEDIIDNVQEGIDLDGQTAVVVRDTHTGQLELISEPQVFIPSPHQEVVDVRQRIILEDNEAIVIRSQTGKYIIKRGSDSDRAFFLSPYFEIVKLRWSTGLHKDRRGLELTKCDLRPKFMWYEFDVRTKDNVELVIGITFFWEVVDFEAMIRKTDDTPGDICSHARSAIIQSVSQVTLENFLSSFNLIIYKAVIENDNTFYNERGVRLNAVEVRSIACKDPSTQQVLQEIITETTNRLNRQQKQESDNEIKLKQIKGEIEAEEMRGSLITLRREHAQIEAMSEGEAEANRVQEFLDGLGDMSLQDKMIIFNTIRKQESLEALSTGNASLYFTPADVNLSIET